MPLFHKLPSLSARQRVHPHQLEQVMKMQTNKNNKALNVLKVITLLVSLLYIAQPAYADRGRHGASHPRLVEDWRAPRHYSNNYHRPAQYRDHYRYPRYSNYRPAPRRYFDRQYAWEPVYYQPYREPCDNRRSNNYYRYRR